MKTTQFFLAAACAFLLSTTAFAQTTPSSTGTMQNGTSSGTMQNGTSNGTMQNGTSGRMQNSDGTMQNGSMSGRMNSKSKMSGHKGMKKTKTSSTTPSSTGTM